MGDEQLSAEYNLHFLSCLKDSASVWKQPWECGLLGNKRKAVSCGPLPLDSREASEAGSSGESATQPASQSLAAVVERLAKYSKYEGSR